MPLQQLLRFAVDITREAGQSTLPRYRSGLAVERKADRSLVTAADREAEQLLRQRIEERYPDHCVQGEEYGITGNPGASHRWVLDPIDGTFSFVHGIPLYTTLVALVVENEPAIGVAYAPALDEMVAAARGHGCTWNGEPCRVSSVPRLSDSLFTYTSYRGFERNDRKDAVESIFAATERQRGWSDAYGMMMVATGRAELHAEPMCFIWDCAPFLPIIEEAGGRFTDWSGRRRITSDECLATNGHVHDELLRVLSVETD